MMKRHDYRLGDKDVFVLDFPDNDIEAVHWVYSPLAEVSLLVGDKELVDLQHAFDNPDDIPDGIQDEYRQLTLYEHTVSDLKKEIEAESFDRLVIIPNTICNFNCSYCFSAAGRMGKEVDLHACYAAVDDYLQRKKDAVLKLGFVGGGEPMLSFDIVEKTLEYAARLASEHKMDYDFHIVTNGSIIDDTIVKVLRKYHVTLGISFEILKDVQETQRGHYALVSQNIRRFIEAGIVPGIKTTITPFCVSRMNEMVETAHTDYPEIQNILFQVVNDPSLFVCAEAFRDFLSDYIRNFFTSKHLGVKKGIKVQDTLQAHCKQSSCRYCPGEYCLTPSGTLSSCDCVSSPKESLYETFVYGTVVEKSIRINHEKLLQLKKSNVFSEEKCSHCFAKYHCGSDCLYRRKILPPHFHAETCRFNKEFIRRELFDTFSDALYSVTGKDISDYLASASSEQTSPHES